MKHVVEIGLILATIEICGIGNADISIEDLKLAISGK